MAERLGKALQKLLQRFESASDLKNQVILQIKDDFLFIIIRVLYPQKDGSIKKLFIVSIFRFNRGLYLKKKESCLFKDSFLNYSKHKQSEPEG